MKRKIQLLQIRTVQKKKEKKKRSEVKLRVYVKSLTSVLLKAK